MEDDSIEEQSNQDAFMPEDLFPEMVEVSYNLGLTTKKRLRHFPGGLQRLYFPNLRRRG